jgi:hypothetical protein
MSTDVTTALGGPRLAQSTMRFTSRAPSEKPGDRFKRLTSAFYDEGKGSLTPDLKALDFRDWR